MKRFVAQNPKKKEKKKTRECKSSWDVTVEVEAGLSGCQERLL